MALPLLQYDSGVTGGRKKGEKFVERGSQKTGKQLVYFMTKDEFDACQDDVIRILLPTGKYCAHDLNFLNCFLNNTPPKAQKFLLHWCKQRDPQKAVMQDVLEIITVQLTQDDGEREVKYLIPVHVLLNMLGIHQSELHLNRYHSEERSRDIWDNNYEDMAAEREQAYNRVLEEYCRMHDIAFHCIQGRV